MTLTITAAIKSVKWDTDKGNSETRTAQITLIATLTPEELRQLAELSPVGVNVEIEPHDFTTPARPTNELPMFKEGRHG